MAKRALVVLSVVLLVSAGIAAYLALYLTQAPGSAMATPTPSATGSAAQLYLATVPASEATDPHPSWVSYYITDSKGSNWQHKTTFDVPAHSLVRVTIRQYDGDSGLRNPFLSQAMGTVGGTFTLNGKTTQAIDPDTASHVFAIPELGVSVPLQGVPDNAKNPCGNAPCTLSQAHQTITFTFRTGAKGLYRWQCFVPCAAGYIDGFGGPMQTVGYMDGFVKVV
jgi:hypothetical protein